MAEQVIDVEETPEVIDPAELPEPPDVSHLVTESDDPIEMPEPPDISHLVTEDDKPVDNLPSEKQQRLLVEPLYSSWNPDRPFLAAANVGLFGSVKRPAIVPDVLLSLDITVPDDWWAKEHRSYFVWEFEKPPEVVIEIVSNTKGRERDYKLGAYARLGIWYYAIFDPQKLIQDTALELYELHLGEYVLKEDYDLSRIGLSLTLWEGLFEDKQDTWLRWSHPDGEIILTGNERAEQERIRAEQEHTRAEQEHARAERLAAQLRAMGVEPEE